MDYKIVQIIPNNLPIIAQYMDEGKIENSDLLVIALVEYEDGERAVITLDIDMSTGVFESVDSAVNFIGMDYKK